MCAQNCHNTVGSYNCSCYTGYRLNADGFACDGEWIAVYGIIKYTLLITMDCPVQILTSVLKALTCVLRTAPIPSAPTLVAVTLATD